MSKRIWDIEGKRIWDIEVFFNFLILYKFINWLCVYTNSSNNNNFIP